MTEPARRAGGVRAFELVRFVALGATSTVLYLALYTVLVLAGLPFLLASIVAFLPVAVYGYVVHDRWTFRTRTPTRGGLARWLLLQGTMLGLNSLALWGLVVQAGLNRLLAQVMLVPLIPPTTYLLSRRRVFRAS